MTSISEIHPSIEWIEEELINILKEEGLEKIFLQMGFEEYYNNVKLWYSITEGWFIRSNYPESEPQTCKIESKDVFRICAFIFFNTFVDELVVLNATDQEFLERLGYKKRGDFGMYQASPLEVYEFVKSNSSAFDWYIQKNTHQSEKGPLGISATWSIPGLLVDAVIRLRLVNYQY